MPWPRVARPALSVLAPREPAAGRIDAATTRVLPAATIAVVVWAWSTVEPLGASGTGLLGTCLMIAGTAALCLRFVPVGTLPASVYLLAFGIGGVVCGVLLAFDPTSAATAFGPILVGVAGFRFATVPAVAVAVVTTAAATVALWVRFEAFQYGGLFLGLAVLIGMTRRDRTAALRLAHEKVEQTERAVASEAHAQVLAERARVAREIHDVLAHSLSGVNMQINLADALLEENRTDDGRAALATAQTMVSDGLVEARKAVYALRDESRDLVPGIESMVVSPRESLTVRGALRPVDATATGQLLRIVGEALANTRRHAPGEQVSVTVDFGGERVRIEVRNPIDTRAAPFGDGAGLGVQGMRDRAGEMGAELTAGPERVGETDTWAVTVEVHR